MWHEVELQGFDMEGEKVHHSYYKDGKLQIDMSLWKQLKIIIMEAKEVYWFCINNCKNTIKQTNPTDVENHINVFRMAEVLSIAFCKTKEDVLLDFIKDEEKI